MWFLAGCFTAVFGLSTPSKLFDVSLPLSFPMKVGGVWAAAGLFLVAALPTWFNMSLERTLSMRRAGTVRSDPGRVALLSTASRALLLGAGAGFALAQWVVPQLGVPDGLVLGDVRSAVGAVLTALAYLICVPVAAAVASRLR